VSDTSEREERKESEYLEEHEIAGEFCSAVLQGHTFTDSAFFGKASPSRKLRGIHKREEGQVKKRVR
jgi:hypothetical protein